MEIYIVRHGETYWNEMNKLQGQTDIELNDKGIAAAIKLGEQVKDISFDCVYSSPLIRALKTAQCIIGDRDIPIITDARLKEISFGELEGTSNTIWKTSDSEYRFFFDAPEKYIAPPGGESFEEVIKRTGEFYTDKISKYANDNRRILVVGHGALNAGFMCNLENRDINHYWGSGLQRNCEATVYRYVDSKWVKCDN